MAVETLYKTVNNLRDVVKVISIGVDYKKYALFDAIAPEVRYWNDGTYESVEVTEYFYNRVHASKDLCDLCIHFVIDCAVKLQDSDYETLHSLVMTHYK